MNNSEQLMDDIVTAIVGGAQIIAGAMLVLGGFVVGVGHLVSTAIFVNANMISKAMLEVGYLPLITTVLSSGIVIGGFRYVMIGSKRIQDIYNNRRLRRS